MNGPHPMDNVPAEDRCGWVNGIVGFPPKMKWRWYVFGGMGTKWIPMMVDLAESTLWHRILTRIVLRSNWERLQ
jgi:hypothetical protein